MSPAEPTYQFNSQDADAILLSHPLDDCFRFKVHKSILVSASPFFKDMFSLPQPATSSEKLALVPLSEDRETLDLLLRFVYPIPDPPITSLDGLAPVLHAAMKYDFLAVVMTLRKVLVSPQFLHNEPTRVFAIASRYDFEHEAKIASRHTLSIQILDCPLHEDLKHITAFSYHQLLDFHKRRAKAAIGLLKYPEDIKCMQCNGSSYGVFMAPKWWTEFEKMAKEELSARPTTDRIFELGFLARVANAANCQRCPGSMLDSHMFLQNLKRQIDDLPSTI